MEHEATFTNPRPAIISMDSMNNGQINRGIDPGTNADPAVIDAGPMQNVYQPGASSSSPSSETWTTSDRKNLVDERGERCLTRADVEEEERRITRRNHIIIGITTGVMALVFALTILFAVLYA